MWHSSKEHFFEDKFEKRLNFGHFCSYVLNSAKKSHMIWNFQRRYFLMGILCKLTLWRWHHSKYPMPKLNLEFSFKFQKSNLFYYSTLTKCSNQHSISRILKPRFFKQKRLVWKHCFHGSNIWSWKLKNNTLTQTVYLPMYDLFDFDLSWWEYCQNKKVPDQNVHCCLLWVISSNAKKDFGKNKIKNFKTLRHRQARLLWCKISTPQLNKQLQ